jgi:hypothetical protein
LSLENIEQLKKENQDFQTILQWLEEYSTIKINDNDIAKVKIKGRFETPIPLTALKTFLENPRDKDMQTFRSDYISFSETSIITIEEPTFDIFKLEKEVGMENTLSTVSFYIFASMGFYSLIQYEKFEYFIKEITKGYLRENPYHHVKGK